METPITNLDPDLVADVVARSGAVSRRDAIRKTALYSAALAASPLALAAISKEAYSQSLPQGIRDVLMFALTLEHLEYEFYRDGLAASGLIPTANGQRALFETILAHENDHVRFLQSALGLAQGTGAGAAGRPPNGFDYTRGGQLDTLTNYQTYLVVSQGFEDTGVRAYKGQAGNLISNDAILTAALQIHSVEGRHASAVRRVRGEKGWITLDNVNAPPNTIQAAYAGEAATPSVPGGFTAAQISESFDEPLTKEQVLAIATPFIRP